MPGDEGAAPEPSRSGRRRRPPLVTRPQAIEAAYGLLNREGPGGLSMRKLASALHVSLPTVYTAVASREVLIGELQIRLVGEVAEALALEAPGRASGDLAAMAEVLQGWAEEHPTLADFLLVEPIPVTVISRLVNESPDSRRAAAATVLRTFVGATPPEPVNAVAALAYVLAQARAGLSLSLESGLVEIPPQRWLQIGCDNIATGLRSLGGLPTTSST